MTNDQIYDSIQNAIRERRLLPGVKLVEERLAEVTKVSRMRVRQVLSRLAHEQIVTLVPHKGAFVSQPSVEEAREMFEVRRLIEPPSVAKLAASATSADIKKLRAHVEKEQQARKDNDFHTMVRLSGEFHVLLISMIADNVLLKLIKELTSLTCLIITLYDRPNAPSCPQHEHVDLVNAIAAGDTSKASMLMMEHLVNIEETLDLHDIRERTADLESIFSDLSS